LTQPDVAQHFRRSRTDRRHRILIALLAVPFLLGVIGAPVAAPRPVQGDELSSAKAQQKQLERKIAEQKRLIARINSSQAALAGAIASTKTELSGITDNLAATRKKVAGLVKDIDEVKTEYEGLVTQLGDLDLQLERIERQETAKKAELAERKAELADRIRQAYEAERTSMLETFLSGASFTDMLAEMSTQLDAADQDRALAEEIAQDRETLLALHQTVDATRDQTNTLRQETAVQKQKLDQRLAELKKAQARLKKLEAAAKAALAAQKAQYSKMSSDKAKLARAIKAAAAAKKKLQKKIDSLVAKQFNMGHIPSQYNGTLRWPMAGSVTQPFGCTGFSWEPPSGSCPHFHNGIDIVAPYGTPVRASGAGRVVYVGWNYADGADPAWIVIIAHSSNLTTWYAHLQARYPVHAGSVVKAGQIIGYEGNTGHSTGAHLHWMVEFNGSFVNPRLFT
jgi:murein DD-endopeptidase MepM/ murein hydrolase activator NlpD